MININKIGYLIFLNNCMLYVKMYLMNEKLYMLVHDGILNLENVVGKIKILQGKLQVLTHD